jgi:hypothetical protein
MTDETHECDYCGLSVRPDEAMSNDDHYHLHRECWYELASVPDRVEHQAQTPGWLQSVARRARDADEDPQTFLLDLLGDPSESFDTRAGAEYLLSSAVPPEVIAAAQVECPNCGEGETFPVDPATDEVRCHCGHVMRPARTGD